MGASLEEWETLQRNTDHALAVAGQPIPKGKECSAEEPRSSPRFMGVDKFLGEAALVLNETARQTAKANKVLEVQD